ncbi:hypothetical protein G5S37_18500 [Roseimicrobium sp. ORNL1]|nr:hypothetical protein G5S37_18500 [Roseimicrobium sp. ORNL1]
MSLSQTQVVGLLTMFTALLAPCCTPPEKPASSHSETRTAPSDPSIGTATMREDGTIEMQLRAEAESDRGKGSGIKGDALIKYAPGDPHYDEVLKHLGGLKKGETKPVPPWPEKKS